MSDLIEFYDNKDSSLVISVKSSIVPDEGRLISIRKTTYVVTGHGYAVDHADRMSLRSMRAVVYLSASQSRLNPTPK